MNRLDRISVAFWIFTGGFAGLMVLSAALYLSGSAQIKQTLVALGYPEYILTILGTAKLVGAIALLQSRLPTVREWAYAGFTINLVAATASHLLAGDPASAAFAPAMLLLPLAASYLLRPDRARVRGRIVTSSDQLAAA